MNVKIDPFQVPQQPHYLKQIAIFLLMLPISILSFLLFILLAIPLVPVYRSLTVPLNISFPNGSLFGS